MGRRLRYVPEEGSLVEVTCRTLQGRLLLRPSPELNEIIVGVLARAQRLHPVQIVLSVFLSNHYHLLLRVENALQLATFMEYLNSNLAREVSRLTDWSGKIWDRRYQAILVSDEELAQIERFKYLLSHGCKEGLVGKLREWPGVHSVRALLEGEPLSGFWFNRTREYAARRRGQAFDRLEYATPETLTLAPLPCWQGLPSQIYRERVAELVQQIEAEATAARQALAKPFLGAKAILAQDPHTRPERLKKSPAPLCHAASKAVRKLIYEAYAWFAASFRSAAEMLRATGSLTAPFPAGSFPPALPFVGG